MIFHVVSQTFLKNYCLFWTHKETNNSDTLSTRVKKVALEAIDSFTGHGVSNIVLAETRSAKVAWSVVLVLFFIPCCYYLNNSIAGFFQYDVISNIKIYNQAELSFPAIVICGWFSDDSIVDSIVYCTFNKQDCRSEQIEFEPIIVTGYGLSFKHNCIRINGQNVLDISNNQLLSVKQNSINDAGLSIAFLIPRDVSYIYSLTLAI
jgi:hypothetical protein